MADLNKFQRSRDRITEIHSYLMNKTAGDEKTSSHISELEKSIRIIDHKIEELKKRELVNN